MAGGPGAAEDPGACGLRLMEGSVLAGGLPSLPLLLGPSWGVGGGRQ